MIKHTPGPWKHVATTYIQAPRRYADQQHDIDVARVETGTELYAGEAVANAKLIASAPDLAEALKALLSEVDEMTSRVGWAGNGARDAARAALVKAGLT